MRQEKKEKEKKNEKIKINEKQMEWKKERKI